MSLGDASELDFMLQDAGDAVVFLLDGVVQGRTWGLLRKADAVQLDGSGISIQTTDTTLLIRDGSQPASWKEGAILTVGGVSFRLRDPGVVQPDGLRKAVLVERV